MKTERYKCIAQPDNKGMHFTIGNSYEFELLGWTYYTYDNIRQKCAFNIPEFHYSFQKVEAPNSKEMKYKVTITNVDATGQVNVIVHEDVSMDTIKYWLEDAQMPYKSILTEPMPEKKKVTVWFYLYEYLTDNLTIEAVSGCKKDELISSRQDDIDSGYKVSEIFSKEVEI